MSFAWYLSNPFQRACPRPDIPREWRHEEKSVKCRGLAKKKSLLSLPRCREMFATFLFLTFLTHSGFGADCHYALDLFPS